MATDRKNESFKDADVWGYIREINRIMHEGTVTFYFDVLDMKQGADGVWRYGEN